MEPDDVVITDIGGQDLDIFLHGPQSAHKNSIVNTLTHTSIPIQPCTLLRKRRKKKETKNKNKMLNSPNIMLSFTGPLPVQCGAGRRQGRMAPALWECSTVEVFFPRTVLTENICRCVQPVLQHFLTTIPILTASTITFSWIASTAHQADSWWLGHVEPDDVIIADIGGQALNIFLHGPQSAHKNGIVKTNIRSHMHSHSPMHTAKAKKEQTPQLT